MWRRARASSNLQIINGKLRRALATDDIPGLIAGIQQLARTADLRADDLGLQPVMANVEQALKIIARSGSPAEIDAAIAACRQAASGTAHPLLAATFLALTGKILAQKFVRTKEMADLDAATSAFQQAADAAPESDPIREVYQLRLAQLHSARSRLAGAAREDERHERLRQIADSGSDLIDQGLQAGDPAALTAGIVRLRQALDIAPDQDQWRPAIISDLGVALRHRFELTGALADLDAAVEAQRQAVEAASAGHAHRATYLSNLSHALRIRFERTGTPADLDAAELAARLALDSCAADDGRRAVILSHLGLALLDGYRHTASLGRLEEAVAACQQAVHAAPDQAGRASCLMNLGLSLLARFERSGDLADADAAVEASRQALDSAGPPDRNRATYLTSYASALRLRGERTGSLPDISAAVQNDQQAVAASRPGEFVRAMRISHLGVSLLRRYALTGATVDLNAAVEAGHRSVATAADDDPYRALCLTNLSFSLLRRFERDGTLADLNAAVEASQQAVAVLPDTDPGRPRYLGNLANVLEARFVRLGAAEDLDRAVDVSRQAVAACPDDDANRGSYRGSLAGALQLRFLRSRSAADLDESVDFSRRALAAIPSDHQVRGMVLAGLALGLILRFSQTRAIADLNDAVEAGRSALAAAAADDPNRALFLGRILTALGYRFELTGAPADLDDGLAAGREAAATSAAPPSIRAGAAMTWGHLAARAQNWPEAVRAYRTAIDLLPTVTPRGLARVDQEHQLTGVAGLGSRAAACCLELGQADLAAELLEHGRGVLLGQALDTRTDLTALAERHPDVADRFTRLRDELDAGPRLGAPGEPGGSASLSSGSRPGRPDLEAERRKRLASELDAVIAAARRLPGFEGFLLPPAAGELLTAAGEGPVVLVNVDEIRSDALVLTPAGLRHVPLPDLSAADVRRQVTEFLGALGELPDPAGGLPGPAGGLWDSADRLSDSAGKCRGPAAGAVLTGEGEARLCGVLGWLWDAVTGPVLAELGITGRPAAGQQWPRIWWCPTGLLSLLPLHAAGHHGTRFDAAPMTVIDRVVSSYTPTVRALLHGRRPPGRPGPHADADADPGQILVVAMPRTAGAPDLEYAAEEVAFLRAQFGPSATVLDGTEGAGPASYEEVRAALPRFRWAHFACHATSRLDDPSASHLVLPDHAGRKLSVVDVGRLHLDHAELAFLSACSTARTGAALPDEAINLAAAFQLAGYRRVVATMWPVEDKMAARLASACYEELAPAGTAEAVARVLHDATRRIRATHADQPSMWAAHMHSGT